MSEYNPFAAPSVYGDVASENMPRREYGGIGRAAYFGLGILLNVIVQVVQAGGVAVQSPALIYATFPFAIFGGCALAWHRCKNLGMNPWWCLGIMVPIPEHFRRNSVSGLPGRLRRSQDTRRCGKGNHRTLSRVVPGRSDRNRCRRHVNRAIAQRHSFRHPKRRQGPSLCPRRAETTPCGPSGLVFIVPRNAFLAAAAS